VRHLWSVLTRHRDYRVLLSAGLVSMTGDWILNVGLVYYVYALTGSTLASGTVLLAAIAPQVLMGSVAGVYVDRWDRKRTMVAANVLLAVILLPLLAVNDASRLWIVYPVVVLSTCVEQFFYPAEQALVPHLVDEGDLITANALNGQSRNLARLVGAAIGGVAAHAGGIALVAVIDAATFVVAAALLTMIRARPLRPAPNAGQPASLSREWRDGLVFASQQPALRVILVVAALTALGEGVMGTLFAPFVRVELNGSGADYGAILSAQAVGGTVAGFVAAAVGHRFPARSLFGWGALCFGLVDLMLFLYPLLTDALWPGFVFIVVVGLPAAVMLAGMTTLLQTSSHDSHRGRVFGAIGAIQAATSLCGVVLAGVLGDVVGILPILALQGVMYVLAGCYVIAAMPRTAATLTRPGEELDRTAG
jgi:Na+/melibiose symporter-like transporter